MIKQVIASPDPALEARILSCTPLLYGDGPDPALDRPAYVRAGSSLARVGRHLAVVQDDANFIALIDPQSGHARAITLPAGANEHRQFDDLRGNKRFKFDLEACVAIPDGESDVLIAFGSGSSPLRERIAVVKGLCQRAPEVVLYDAPELYATLRATREFAGSEMNIEGAVFIDGRIRLFGRGNGAPGEGLLPLDATCDLDWAALRAYLHNPRMERPPAPGAVIQYQLGSLGGLRLGFTDATVSFGRLVFCAAAECSPDATRDGPVAGSVLGVFDAAGGARWAVLRDHDGGCFSGKVEGLSLATETPYRAHVVVDRDDPDLPSELCEVELSGPWY